MKNLRALIIMLLLVTTSSGYANSAKMGRKLFVDKTWIGETNMTREFHRPDYYQGNPVLKAEESWEFNINGDPYAAPFSGGVWYDEEADIFKMWYSAGGGLRYGLMLCYAESKDGRNWVRPELDVYEGTNIVDKTEHDCASVMLDKFEKDPAKKYKMFVIKFNPNPETVSMVLKYSADGIHWGKPVALSGEVFDRCAAYYDPFKEKYIISLKTINGDKYRRARSYLEHSCPETAVSLAHRDWSNSDDKYIKYWFNAEDEDPRHPDFPHIRPQIYNHEAMPYENQMLAYFSLWQGPENDDCDSLNIQKRNEVLIGWAENGFDWNRENRTPFLPVSEDKNAWNAGNVQSTNGNPIIVGDSIYFYVSGRYETKPKHDSNFCTGLATMRRDGFVSLASEDKDGYLVTSPLTVEGSYLFANIQASELAVEVLDENGDVVDGFSKRDFKKMKRVNSTKLLLEWKDKNIEDLKGKKVSFKFYVNKGQLYSFWVSKWQTGESEGYTAGGGPGLHPSGVDIPVN